MKVLTLIFCQIFDNIKLQTKRALTSSFVFQAVFTLEEKVSFNPLRLFANPVNLLAYLRGEGEL